MNDQAPMPNARPKPPQGPSRAPLDHWALGILWSLVFGHWSFVTKAPDRTLGLIQRQSCLARPVRQEFRPVATGTSAAQGGAFLSESRNRHNRESDAPTGNLSLAICRSPSGL